MQNEKTERAVQPGRSFAILTHICMPRATGRVLVTEPGRNYRNGSTSMGCESR